MKFLSKVRLGMVFRRLCLFAPCFNQRKKKKKKKKKALVGNKKGQLMDGHEVSVCFGLLAPIYLGANEFLAKLS
jgi:hypothetical protein